MQHEGVARPFDCLRSLAHMPIPAQRSSIAGSRFGRSPFIGKPVFGRKTVQR